MNKSVIGVVFLVACAAFFSGYFYGGSEESPLVSESSADNPDLESRISELLVVFPYYLTFESSYEPWGELRFVVMHAGTENVILSDIQINGISNSSSPSWKIETGDDTIEPGEVTLITVNATKYYPDVESISFPLRFSFNTTRGNTFYCVPPWEEPPEIKTPRFEKIEIVDISAAKDDSLAQFNITMNVRNTGSTDAEIAGICINGEPEGNYGATDNMPPEGFSIQPGETRTLTVYVPTSSFPSGTTIEIRLHTADGMAYPVIVTLS